MAEGSSGRHYKEQICDGEVEKIENANSVPKTCHRATGSSWLWVMTSSAQDEEKVHFLEWTFSKAHCGPQCHLRPCCGHMQSVLPPEALVMSLGFPASGCHADTSGMCNRLRPGRSLWPVQLLRAMSGSVVLICPRAELMSAAVLPLKPIWMSVVWATAWSHVSVFERGRAGPAQWLGLQWLCGKLAPPLAGPQHCGTGSGMGTEKPTPPWSGHLTVLSWWLLAQIQAEKDSSSFRWLAAGNVTILKWIYGQHT